MTLLGKFLPKTDKARLYSQAQEAQDKTDALCAKLELAKRKMFTDLLDGVMTNE